MREKSFRKDSTKGFVPSHNSILEIMHTDYSNVNNLLLAYPERFYNEYESLASFYESLIDIIPNSIKLWIVCNNQSSIEKLKHKYSYKKLNLIGLKGWDEIWLRDCIGFKRGNEVVKPYYHPNYCEMAGPGFNNYYYKINKLSKVIIKECISEKIINLPLKLDGGNFVNNGTIAFLTDKVLTDNRELSKSEILKIIKDFTGLQAIILPRSINDNVGHLDSLLAFISKNKACISSYPSLPFLKQDIEVLYKIRGILEEEKIEVFEINDRPIDEVVACNCYLKNKKACFSTARGNYLNFLRLNNTVILPEYKLTTLKETNYYNSINREVFENQGFEILSLNCDQLAKKGGVLHCISYTF